MRECRLADSPFINYAHEIIRLHDWHEIKSIKRAPLTCNEHAVVEIKLALLVIIKKIINCSNTKNK